MTGRLGFDFFGLLVSEIEDRPDLGDFCRPRSTPWRRRSIARLDARRIDRAFALPGQSA